MCLNKQCQPVLVDDDGDNTSPYDLSIDDGVIFFTNSATDLYSVRSIDKTLLKKGIGVSTLIVGSIPQPYEIATTGTSVFFSTYGASDNGGKIERCATGDCMSPPTMINLDSFAVATDGMNVVYGDKFTPTDGGDAVFTVRKTTLTLTPSTVLMTFPSEVFWLKIFDGVVYVGVSAFLAPGGVYACPLTGCGDNPTHLSELEAEEIYVVNNTVYFTNASGSPDDNIGEVHSVGIDGNNPLTLATKLSNPLGIIADSTFVYFSDTGDIDNGGAGKLLRCPLTGCGTNNALGVDYGQGGNPQGLVDDGIAIYWGDYAGKIWKLAK